MSAINLRASSFRPATTLRRPSRAPRGAQPPGRPAMRVEALRNFDCRGDPVRLRRCAVRDGRDGHRVTFNMTFKEKGLDHEWGVDQYGELLKIGGGKERMTHYFNTCADEEPFATTYRRRRRAQGLHQVPAPPQDRPLPRGGPGRKAPPPRRSPPRERSLDNGAKVAVCSTSNEKAVKGIVATMLPSLPTASRLCGDVVPKKKPAPDIYNLAAETLG